MPRGGPRPGAGRPKGSKACPQLRQTATLAAAEGLTPLQFLLAVMRDESADLDLRLRAASLALPFTAIKPGDLGKREQAALAAVDADAGTAWERLLA